MTVELIIRTLATMIIAYLIGSLNPAIIITRLKTGKDIRTMGSGNAGFTNVLRSVGKGPAIATIICDYLKGHRNLPEHRSNQGPGSVPNPALRF